VDLVGGLDRRLDECGVVASLLGTLLVCGAARPREQERRGDVASGAREAEHRRWTWRDQSDEQRILQRSRCEKVAGAQ
jgi:hypothetical protein